MFGSAKRLALLAAITTIVCAAWTPVHRQAASARGDFWGRSTFEANVWISALPSVLTAPAGPLGLQLVSMIADDIDADGDLDVLATDGSLDIIVWINDGTGHLSRKDSGNQSGRPHPLPGPGLSDQPPESQGVASTSISVLGDESSIASCPTDGSQAGPFGSADSSMPFVVFTRSPRGPPFPRLAS